MTQQSERNLQPSIHGGAVVPFSYILTLRYLVQFGCLRPDRWWSYGLAVVRFWFQTKVHQALVHLDARLLCFDNTSGQLGPH